MADYGSQQGRNPGRPQNYGQQALPHQRDAAFSSIFGAAPPAGRSRTMTSQSPSPNGRTQTMSSMSSQAPEPLSRAPQNRQQPPPQGYFSQAPDVYQSANGVGTPHQQQPQPQYLPQPVHPERRQYPPQRVETQPSIIPGPYAANGPQRGYPPIPVPPAMSSNAYRAQSMASTARPVYNPANSYNVSSASTFRQQPYVNRSAHTTAQGRVVPERIDERSMSMSSLNRDHDRLQTMNGRVIPNRQREPVVHEEEAHSPGDAYASNQNYSSPQPSLPGSKTRTPSNDAQSIRTMSMASTIAPSITPSAAYSDRTLSMTHRPSVASQTNGSSSQSTARRRAPLVNTALLSKVSEAFKEQMAVTEKVKNGLVYPNAFTGTEAIDLLCYIMHSRDRNLALLLGRALDSSTQKLFHEVTYANRLRDSDDELYQFYDRADVHGVFTIVTECYSPTCTKDRLCYSIACPNRSEQSKRLNMRPQPGLKREASRTSLHEERANEQKLWINTVSKEVANSVDDKEKKRQEVISELCYTERDFCTDLKYLKDYWITPLQWSSSARQSPIPEARREKFIQTVFHNCLEILNVNERFSNELSKRQRQNPVVRNVGDLFLHFIPEFGPFVRYGANQMFGKHGYERERSLNPAFARFADETERLKESRKLELNGYLTKPTTRLARYPLLLENILKYTAEDNPDYTAIPEAIAKVKAILSQVNTESGKSENRFNLMQLNEQLIWQPGEFVDLKLTEETRQLIFKGPMRKTPTDATGEVTAYLFDHALLFARTKVNNKRETLKVYKRPIPLGLLVMSSPDDYSQRLGLAKRPSSSLMSTKSAPSIASTRSTTSMVSRTETNKAGGYPIIFKHLGKGGFEQTLYCTSQIQRQKWYEHVDAQQSILRERSNIFTKTILNEGFFNSGGTRINCCVPIDGGRKLVVGTDFGVYITERKVKDASIKPRRVLDIKNVAQLDVLEQHSILLVLCDKTLYSYTIDALNPEEGHNAPSKRGRKISHASLFKVGVFEGQHLVCCVKPTSLNNSSDIKVYMPDSMPNNKKKSGLAKMLAGGQEVLKPHKEFYVPSETFSIHFLRSTLCVGCARGFEIVTYDTLQTQPLLDQADTSFDFVAQRGENLKPLHVERIGLDFLLCYSDFSFFIDRHGWRSFPHWKITWEGTPQSFAVFQPYILAFEPSFIEMRHLDTGLLVYILTAKNVRMLHSSTREILYAYEDEMGNDVIASLDFWSKPKDGGSSSSTALSSR